MSCTVSISELKAQLSHYLRLARRGETILVKDRSHVVARIERAGPGTEVSGDERLSRLENAGVVRRRHRPLEPDFSARRVHAQARIVEALLAEREEER